MMPRRIPVRVDQRTAPRWRFSPRWRRFDAPLGERLARVGVVLTWAPSVVLLSAAALAIVLGLLAAGVIGGFVGVLLVAAAAVTVDRVGTARDKKRRDELLPEIALRLGRRLRAGQPVEIALAEVSADVGNGHPALRFVHVQLDAGRPLKAIIDEWQRRADGDAEQLLASALMISVRNGGQLASALDGIGDGLRDSLALDRRRRVVLAQTQLSAGVLVGLPIAFVIVSSIANEGVMYRGLSGVVLAAAGVGLDLLGVLWMRRLIRRLK